MPVGHPDSVEPYADRLIREAMESGAFDNLTGEGRPIPGSGTTDDDLWWIRSWVERNREADDQDPSSSS